ncbi:MAG: DUF4159 domain-containing protein [Chitinophagales bacterium]
MDTQKPYIRIKLVTRHLSLVTLFLVFFISTSFAPNSSTIKVGLMKYKGGGDWYANPTALPNLVKFCNENLNTNISEIEEIEPGSSDIFNFPFIHMTGHGNVVFTASEAENLRAYLMAGGFLHIDDNYGMDPYIRPALKDVFPELELVELPFNHKIYQQNYRFEKGLPKIHEHDGQPPQGFGLIYEGRLVVYYTYECDLGDGWEDPQVHKDSPQVREQALKMGANILEFALTQ